MPKVSNDMIIAFSLEFEKCVENIGNNELAIDGTRLRELVAANRDAAWGFVEVYCSMAREQPAYVMTAYVVAVTYEIVFGDDSLEKIVIERAKSLNATKYIFDIRTSL